MVSFKFLPREADSSWVHGSRAGRSAAELDATDFTFHCFRADVLIEDGRNEIHLRTFGLPVIDFVLMLQLMYREIRETGESFVETTQSQHSISALRSGDSVKLSYSFSDVVSVISFEEFEEIPQRAIDAALEVLFDAHGELRENAYLASIATFGG